MRERMTALLDELAGTWEVMAEMEQASKEGRRETLRECSDGLRMLADIVRKAERLVPQPKTDRESVLEELLRSACAIAERQGAGTAWDRFAASVHAVGLNGITARTYRVLPSDEPAPQAEPAAASDTERLSELMRGLEIPPGANLTPQALYCIGAAIADQAKEAAEPAAVGELSKLPEPRTLSRGDEDGGIQLGYTADQMRDYARAALASAPQAREPLSDEKRYDLFEDIIAKLRFEPLSRKEQHAQLSRLLDRGIG